MGIACCSQVEKQEEPKKDYIQEVISERLTKYGNQSSTLQEEETSTPNPTQKRTNLKKKELLLGNKLQITYKLESMSYWKSNKQVLIEEIYSIFRRITKDYGLSQLTQVEDVLENSHQDERLLKQVYYKLFTINSYLNIVSQSKDKEKLAFFKKMKTIDEVELLILSQISTKNESLTKELTKKNEEIGNMYDEIRSVNEVISIESEGVAVETRRVFLWNFLMRMKEVSEKKSEEIEKGRFFVEKMRILKRMIKVEEENRIRKEMLMMKAVIPHKRNMKEKEEDEDEDDEESEGNVKAGNFGSMF